MARGKRVTLIGHDVGGAVAQLCAIQNSDRVSSLVLINSALLTEAPIIVMDEPTSALDAEHEQRILDALRNLKGTRTMILVSHRLSTVARADQIVVLERGHVVEQGTHPDLLAQSGPYAALVSGQVEPVHPS